MGCGASGAVVGPEPPAPEPAPAPAPDKPELKTDAELLEIFARAEQCQEDKGGTAGAELLHTELPAEYWGISLQQLHDFAESIRQLLRTGSHPAGCELFNMSRGECKRSGIPHYSDAKFSDPAIGPNMYQVNTCVVKPVTQQADAVRKIPCLSYALQQNSELGLLCDVFVSHAWGEGVFELTETVCKSWPDKARGAYICVLSNPQNMDHLLADLVSTPTGSPFYRVLLSRPSTVLMVANSSVPIHSRLWCVYEAHCARTMAASVSVVGDPAHFATNPSATKAVSRAIRGAVNAHRKEKAIQDAMEDAGNCFDVLAAGIYYTRYQKMMPRAEKKRVAAMKRMERALDVGKAQCSNAADGAAIRQEISGQADHINSMLCRLIVQDHLQRAPAGPCKLTWYPGQDMVEGIRAMLQ